MIVSLLRKRGNIFCGYKMFLEEIRNMFVSRTQILCPRHCYARQQTGKHLCPQQCVRNIVSSFATTFMRFMSCQIQDDNFNLIILISSYYTDLPMLWILFYRRHFSVSPNICFTRLACITPLEKQLSTRNCYLGFTSFRLKITVPI